MKTKYLLLLPVGLILLLQAIPADRDIPETTNDLSFYQLYSPPGDVMHILKSACFDCHSNHTRYPWYTRIQPVGWWIQNHIDVGREELNFSTIGRWDKEDQADILRHCAKLMKKDEMPLSSYRYMHPEARIDAEQKKEVIRWLLDQAGALTHSSRYLVGASPYAAAADSCEGSDSNPRCCFVRMPEKVTAVLQIAPKTEPGEPIVIRGQLFKGDRKTPYPGVLIYAYQTDAKGEYSKNGNETGVQRWHGRLHAWGKTDSNGRYEIQTIRPAAYPGRTIPAHIHAVVWEPGSGSEPFYIRDFVFADDPFLPKKELEAFRRNPESTGVIELKSNGKGKQVGHRDIAIP